MESIQQILAKRRGGIFTNQFINCGCEKFAVAKRDRQVKEYPTGAIVIHSCPKLKVYQERKGLTRFYQMPKDCG